jgi:hypothetical protein
MANLGLADLKTELGFLLRNRNDSDATNSSRLERWINWAYYYMTHPSVHQFREVQTVYSTTLVTGDYDYPIDNTTLGFNLVAIRWVTHVEASSFTPTAIKRKLKPRSIRWFEERTLPSSKPSVYAVDGEFLYLSGVPTSSENGQVLRVGAYRQPATLTGTNATVLNEYFDRPLLKFSQAFAEADLGDRASALVTVREASVLINDIGSESEMEGEDTGQQVDFVTHSPMGF